MNSYDSGRMIASVILICIGFAVILYRIYKTRDKITIKTITRAAIFAAISVVLYTVPFLKFSLPIFPNFLEIHFDEVPIFIAGFAYGPYTAILVLVIKTIVKLPLSTTFFVGELADLLYSLVFIVPAVFIYRKNRNIKGALCGLGIGTLLQLVVASFFTTFVMLDFYCAVFGMSKESLLNIVKAVNPAVSSLDWPFLLCVSLPFNAIKDALVIVLTFLIYKKSHILIDRLLDTKK